MSRSWEEQRDEIQRLNDLALAHAAGLIDGSIVEEKGRDKEGNPIYTEASDGIDMLARCSNIAKQWMSELRQGGGMAEPEKKAEEMSDAELARRARNM